MAALNSLSRTKLGSFGLGAALCLYALTAFGQVTTVPLEIKRQLLTGQSQAALTWLEQAAANDNTEAALTLGKLYRLGQSVEKNDAKSLEYLRIAANGGLADGQYLLALQIKSTQPTAAKNWLEQAAKQGHKKAARKLKNSSGQTSDERLSDPFWLIENIPPSLANHRLLNKQRKWTTPRSGGETPLMYAVKQEQTLWLEHIVTVVPQTHLNQKDDMGNTGLHHAVITGSMTAVKSLLAAGCEHESSNEAGATPLHIAIALDAAAIAKVIHKEGVDLNQKDANGWSPIMLVQRQQNPKFAFLEKGLGKNLNSRKTNPNTQLLQLIKSGNTQDVKRSLTDGANPNSATTTGASALSMAIRHGDAGMVQALLVAGADLSPASNSSPGLIVQAIEAAKPDVLAVLLVRQKDMNGLDRQGRNALHHAVLANCADCVTELLKYPTNINATNKQGFSALILALTRSNEAIALKIIAQKKVATEQADHNGRTPLWWASANNLQAAITALAAKQANLTPDNQGQNPLHIALERGHLEAFSTITDHAKQEELVALDAAGNSLMHIAARHDSGVALSQLVNAGLEIDSENANGDTPLMLAIAATNIDSTRFLIAKGASTNRRNKQMVSAKNMMSAKQQPLWQELADSAPSEIESIWARLTKQ